MTSVLLQDDRLWNLMLFCWTADPEKRPTMDDVAEKLVCITPVSGIMAGDIPLTSSAPVSGVSPSKVNGGMPIAAATVSQSKTEPSALDRPAESSMDTPISPRKDRFLVRAFKIVTTWIRHKTKKGMQRTLCGVS